MNHELANRAAALAALDFSEENQRIAILEAEREHIAQAIERADLRRLEITRELDRAWDTNPGVAVADALLADAPPTQAAESAASREQLLKERSDLHKGIAELSRRNDDLYVEIRSVQDNAEAKVGVEVAGLVQAYMQQAREAGAAIVHSFAAIAGIASACRAGRGEADQLGQSLAGLMTSGALLDRLNTVQVPSEIIDLFEALSGNGPAVRSQPARVVGIPDDRNMIMAMSAAAQIVAAGARSR